MKASSFARSSMSTLLIFMLVLVSIVLAPVVPAAAATGTICDKFGSTVQGNYIIMNNKWGTDATQCINVTANGFQITRQDGVGNMNGAPVSYPAIYVGCHYSSCSPNTNLPIKISDIGSALGNVNVTFPNDASIYDAAYDIWLNADTDVSGVQDTEIMIWLNHTGAITPVGSNTGQTFNALGRNWKVWTGWNGGNNVVSYVTEGLTTLSGDIKPFILDAITRGAGYGTTSWYLTSVQMGFEPWQGGVGLSVNSFSLDVQKGSTPVTPNATATLEPGVVSQGKPATASSNESASYPASSAVDGLLTTRWASAFSDPQWFQVDLGAVTSINRVVLNWEAAYGKDYQIHVSNDGTNWSTIKTVTNNTSTTNDLAVTTTGRYVRMYGTARATQYGYSLYEFKVYSDGATVTPTPVTPTIVPGTVICEKFGTIAQGNYIVMNNKWGTDASQCINVTSSGFQITVQNGITNVPGIPISFPAIYAGCHFTICSPNTNLPMRISDIGAVLSNVDLTTPNNASVYDTIYDVWLNADTNVTGVQDTEIMIWLNHAGPATPVGLNTGKTIVALGRQWQVWTGSTGSNNVVSYVTDGLISFNGDIKPFILDAITRGAGFGNTSWYLTSVQMGFEPQQGGVGLSASNFSVDVQKGAVTVVPTTEASLVSQGKPAAASSNESAALSPNLAVDGNATTRWASAFSDPQWFQVDLGVVTSINRVVLNWEAAYGKNYQIQVSNDGANWSTIKTVTNNTSTTNDWAVTATGRYVRMYGTARATQYGYSLYEFKVYSDGATVTPTPVTPTPVTPTPITPTPVTPISSTCRITYTKTGDWGTTFNVDVTITNTGSSAINGWNLTWNFPGNQAITNLWNGSYTQTGNAVRAANASWNAGIPAGGSVTFGFSANYSGANTVPTNFVLNGSACQ